MEKNGLILRIFMIALIVATISESSRAVTPTQITNIDDYFKGVRTNLDQLNAQYDKMNADYKACMAIANKNRDTCYANNIGAGSSKCSDNWDVAYKQCEDASQSIYVANDAARKKLYEQLESDLDEYFSGLSRDQTVTAYNLYYEQETACYSKVTKAIDDCVAAVTQGQGDPLGLVGVSCTVMVSNADICLIPQQTRLALGRKYDWGVEQTEQNPDEHMQVKQEVTSPTKNKNENRGRDEFGRINPSFGGYLGDAYVVRSDGTKVIPGKELYLKVEDKIVTGANSKLNFIFKDVGGINLGENTELRVGNALLDQYYLAKGTLKTQLNWGTLPPQRLEFRTPNAVVISKGTEFVVDYNETTNITTVYLNEGILEIDVKDKVINLTAGNYLVIYSDGTTQTNQLESENWDSLGNQFYEVPDTGKTFKKILMAMFFIDLLIILLLTWWMKKKIKNPDKKDKSTSKGTASLVLGILGIILLMVPYIGILFSAIAFCLSRIQKANLPTRLATAGFVLGIIGLILNILFLIIALMGSVSS